MAKYKYEYQCPNCGTQLEFKMRVTLTKRKCPQCGTPITPQEIDRQADENQRQQEVINVLCCLVVVVAVVISFLIVMALRT